MENVSLVAFYGNKPSELLKLIQQLQSYLQDQPLLTGSFFPYEMKQVHGTIIGCEGTTQGEQVVNKWFQKLRAEKRYINFPGLVEFCQSQMQLPVIRWAGYQPDLDYQFRSRQQHPYFRSFQLQSTLSGTIPILIGWPWYHRQISQEIHQLRNYLQKFNLLHKYHPTVEAIDNDFYLRLGTIAKQLTPTEISTIAQPVCQFLASVTPTYIPLKIENLDFVQYQDEALTPHSTRAVPAKTITPAQLRQMYS